MFHLFLGFVINFQAQNLNKTQTKRSNVVCVQCFRVYQLVVSTLFYNLSYYYFNSSLFTPTYLFTSATSRVWHLWGAGVHDKVYDYISPVSDKANLEATNTIFLEIYLLLNPPPTTKIYPLALTICWKFMPNMVISHDTSHPFHRPSMLRPAYQFSMHSPHPPPSSLKCILQGLPSLLIVWQYNFDDGYESLVEESEEDPLESNLGIGLDIDPESKSESVPSSSFISFSFS